MSETEHIAVVYFSASTPGALFAKAAEWCKANDGRYVIEATQFTNNIHGVAAEERYELGLYFEPQT
jgi:hypothetical protein